MASWKKTITTPFKKACTFFNQQQTLGDQQKKSSSHRSRHSSDDNGVRVTDLQVEVMACGYEDIQVMWSMLDKARASTCTLNS